MPSGTRGWRASPTCSGRCSDARRSSARRKPADLIEQLRLAWRYRGLDVRTRRRRHAPVHHEHRRPARRLVRVDAGQGVPGDQRHHRHVGRAGRARHGLRDGAPLDRRRRRRPARQLGLPRGRHGRGRGRHPALGRGVRRRGAHRAPGSSRVLVAAAGPRRGRSQSGEELHAPSVVTAMHPQITFLRQVDRAELPADFVARHRALEVAQRRGEDQPRPRRAARLHRRPGHRAAGAPHRVGRAGPLHRATSSRRSRTRGGAGRRAGRSPTACIPTTFDRTLGPEGVHIMSLFTQWVPHEWSEEPHTEELEAYADRVIDGYTELAPNFKASISTAR